MVERIYNCIRSEFSNRALDIVQVPIYAGGSVETLKAIKERGFPWYLALSNKDNRIPLKIACNTLNIPQDESTGSAHQNFEPKLVLMNCWSFENDEIPIIDAPTYEELLTVECLTEKSVKGTEELVQLFEDWRDVLGDVRMAKAIQGTIPGDTANNIKQLFCGASLYTKNKKAFNPFSLLKNKKIVGLVFAPSWAVGYKLQNQHEFLNKVISFYSQCKKRYGDDSIEFILVDGELSKERLYYYMKNKKVDFYALPSDSTKSKFNLCNIANPTMRVPQLSLLSLEMGRVLSEPINESNFERLDDTTIYMEWVRDLNSSREPEPANPTTDDEDENYFEGYESDQVTCKVYNN